MEVRYSDPVVLQQLWKAIEIIRGQRQIANISRIAKIIQKETSFTTKEILYHIHKAVKDSMVVETLSVGCKGSKAGKEQEGYWIPDDGIKQAVQKESDHDWYCFACHRPGTVLPCKGCPKVYHFGCIQNLSLLDEEEVEKLEKNCWYCEFCLLKRNSPDGTIGREARRILNECLGFVAKTITELAPELVYNPNSTDNLGYNYFIRQHQNLGDITAACNAREFESTSDFLSMVQLIVHNCTILHGDEHTFTLAAVKMLDACKRELTEYEICGSCYFQSNTKPVKHWFCIPCNPPHGLVWAKQKGFEYWPAKFLRVVGEQADVRFFGGHHERALVSPVNMKSIIISPRDLHIKVTKSWEKANEEMKEYIRLTELKYGSKDATEIVKFDFQGLFKDSLKQKSEAGSQLDKHMQERADKHRSEMALYKSRTKRKRHDQGKKVNSPYEKHAKISYAEQDQEVDIFDIEENENSTLPGQTRHSVMPEWRTQIRLFGPKTKLREESARTWPYGTELIVSGLLRDSYRIGIDEAAEKMQKANKLNKFTQTTNALLQQSDFSTPTSPNRKSSSSKCNCRKRYDLVLMRYKACVRKMRRRERQEVMTSSVLYIKRHLKQYGDRMSQLEAENARLMEKNKRLQMKQCISDGNAVLESKQEDQDEVLLENPCNP